MNVKNKLFLAVILLSGCDLFDSTLEAKRILEKAFADKKSHPEITSFDGFSEPEIPGAENNESILGIDSNKNNIRDDIEIWINRSFENYNQRMIARQLAGDLNYKLFAAQKNKVEVISHSVSAEFTTMECMIFVFGRKEGMRVAKIMGNLVFNTKERKEILGNFNNHTFGYKMLIKDMHIGEGYKACSFKIENEETLMKIYFNKK